MRLSLALEIATPCKTCGEPVAVNGVRDHVVCHRCGRRVDLSSDTWTLLLAEPLSRAHALAMNDEAGGVVDAADATFRRVYSRLPLACSDCNAALDAELSAGPVACPSCRRAIAVRSVRGLGTDTALFVGEHDSAAGTAPNQTARPELLACERCGAPLNRVATERQVACTYCRAQNTLPETPATERAPLDPVRKFFVVFESAEPVTTAFRFDVVDDVICDPAGNFVIVGNVPGLTGGSESALYSVDRDFRLRWIHRGVRSSRVWRAGDAVVVGSPTNLAAYALDDGRPRPLDDALSRALRGCDPIAIAPDGASLVATRLGYVVRISIDGRDRSLFTPSLDAELEPPKGVLAKLFGRKPVVDEDSDAPSSVGPRSTESLVATPGGGLVVVGTFDRTNAREVREYAPNGELRWAVALGRRTRGATAWAVAAPHGGALLDANDCAHPHLLWARAGGETVFVGDAQSGGPLRENDVPRLATAPDATMYLFHGHGCVRTLTPDGRVLVSNDAALRADRQAP